MRVRDCVVNATVSIGALFACAGCSGSYNVNVDNGDLSKMVTGSGKESTEVRMVNKAFTGVEATWGQEVVVHVGKTQQVRVVGDDNVVEFVKTEVAGKNLKISMPGAFANIHCRVEVDTPSLGAAANSGSGTITVDGAKMDSFDVAADGSGNVTVSGAGKDFHAILTGSGNVDATQFKCKAANVLVQGSGNVKVAPSKELNAAVQGSGNVICIGQPPKVSKTVNGSGGVVFK